MTFTVSNDSLCNALAIIIKIVSPKNMLPVLDDIVFKIEGDFLHLKGADIENQLTTKVCVLNADGEGEFAVNARNILEAVKNLPELPLTFIFNEDNDTLVMNYQNGSFSLPTQKTYEFPTLPEIKEEDAVTIEIPQNILLENIARTVFATAQNELRPIMNGIFFDLTDESLNIVASDGHQLVRNMVTTIHATQGNKGSFILPKKPAMLLKNFLGKGEEMATITADSAYILVETEHYALRSRLIDGRYPNYNSVIPLANPNRLTADRLTLMAALKRVTPFANDSSHLVKVNIKESELMLEAEDYDFSRTAKEKMTCDYAGQTITIGFKGVSVIEILNNIKSPQIEIQLADASRAALILPAEQPEGQEIVMLQMPMLINS